MSLKTEAKDIALHFTNQTGVKPTPTVMKKSINQAKSLLNSGYTKNEVKKVIDYVVNHTDTQMYSLGYINTSIHKLIIDAEKQEIKEKANQAKKEAKSQGVVDNESSGRNKNKLSKFGVQPWKREKHFSDLFERTRQDN